MVEKFFKNSGIKEKIINQIVDIAQKYEVKKVFLFGSRVRGDFLRGSDIDLAVLGGNIGMFRLDVNDYTDTLLTYDVVDLGCDLNKEFLYSVNKEGILIYEEI